MNFEPNQKQLAFVLPSSCKKAEVIFQKSSDPEEHIHLVVQPARHPRRVISTEQLSQGRWNVLLSWWDGLQHYLQEKEILIAG